MAAGLHRGLTPARLRIALGLLFLALAVPSAALIMQTQRQLKWEALHQQRELAVELAERIDRGLQRRVAIEDARSAADYAFLIAASDPGAPLQRSPLAQLPLAADWPGLLGWFQVDPAGRFSTPLLPEDADARGLAVDALAERRARRDALLDVLAENRLAERRRLTEPEAEPGPDPLAARRALRRPADSVGRTARTAISDADADIAAEQAESFAAAAEPEVTTTAAYRRPARDLPPPPAAPAPTAQFEFDRLNKPEPVAQRAEPPAGKLAERSLQVAAEPPLPQRARRTEQSAVPDPAQPASAGPAPVRIFESELDPFEFARLDSGHFVLFRRVWRNGERHVQGLLIEPQAFLRGTLGEAFSSSVLAASTDLAIAWQGEVIERVPGRAADAYLSASGALQGSLLHRSRLSAPLSGVELQWALRQLPPAPGATQLAWSGALLLGVLLAGFAMLYRLGLRQIRLARQQHDFIAAVSHELKTPLTSIRMYGELLRAGWAPEARRREYYDFIHDEAERLSRLIANVLQLARLERDELQFELKPYPATTLFDLIRSKVHGQIERAGFEVDFHFDPACAALETLADADALVQIMINLVDNALKFSARAPRQRLEIAVSRSGRRLQFSVRDYGPGVPPALRRRVFELFFRGGNELTREASGTGIGLALVRQLAHGMRGEVEVVAGEPGAEFRLSLPLCGVAETGAGQAAGQQAGDDPP
jgi:signal transduction histidine kinase